MSTNDKAPIHDAGSSLLGEQKTYKFTMAYDPLNPTAAPVVRYYDATGNPTEGRVEHHPPPTLVQVRQSGGLVKRRSSSTLVQQLVEPGHESIASSFDDTQKPQELSPLAPNPVTEGPVKHHSPPTPVQVRQLGEEVIEVFWNHIPGASNPSPPPPTTVIDFGFDPPVTSNLPIEDN
jgi:hypothetical protein